MRSDAFRQRQNSLMKPPIPINLLLVAAFPPWARATQDGAAPNRTHCAACQQVNGGKPRLIVTNLPAVAAFFNNSQLAGTSR